MNTGDIRYGESPFPYGPNYDLGISLDITKGMENDPNGLTKDVEYVEMTVHGAYGFPEMSSSEPFSYGRTIYIRKSLMDAGTTTTLRISDVENRYSGFWGHGFIIGVTNSAGLIGYFAWYGDPRGVELPSGPRVFDHVLTSENVTNDRNDSELVWGAAVHGSPLYYFTWSREESRVTSPIKRVLPFNTFKDSTINTVVGGVFVPLEGNELGVPVPAIFFSTILDYVYGEIEVKDVGLGEPVNNPSLNLGEVKAKTEYQWAPGGGRSYTTKDNGLASFSYDQEFSSLLEDYPGTTGYFCVGSYNENLSIDLQPTTVFGVFQDTDRAYIYLLDEYIGFPASDGVDELFLTLSPPLNQAPHPTAQISFGLTTAEPEPKPGLAVSKIAIASRSGNLCRCSFSPVDSMFIVIAEETIVEYNKLSNGTLTNNTVQWDDTNGAWVPVEFPIPNGTKNKQVLTWDGNHEGGSWVPDSAPGVPDGKDEGDMLVWRKNEEDGEWVAEPAPLLPPADNMDTLYYDEEEPEGEGEPVGRWRANSVMQWDKENSNVILDFEELPNISSEKQMPGVVMKHPAGGTCGLVVNIEGGTSAGPRLDMGWGGDKGGNFELYSNAHPTRPGQFRVIYGPSGHIEWKNYRSGSTWKTTAGITKEGRLFCGFNDTGFPGGSETYGSYDAPKHPLQVFNEGDNDSVVSAGISKEGRAFFGVAGTMPATVQHPVEVYNGETGVDQSRTMYISKDGKILTTAEVGGKTHVAQIDCNDISFGNSGDEAPLVIKLREVYVMVMGAGGKLVAKKTMMMCSAPYGEAKEVAGGHFDLRYDSGSKQLQKQTEVDGGWTMISGGQFVEETV